MKTIFKNTNFCFKNQSKLNISMIEKTTSPNVTFLSYSKIVFYICFYTAATGASTPAPTPSTTTSNRGLVFLYNITKDNINICQTGNLIFALARNNQDFAESVAAMVFQGVKMTDYYMNFFRLLTMLTELPGAGGPPGMPCFTRYIRIQCLFPFPVFKIREMYLKLPV